MDKTKSATYTSLLYFQASKPTLVWAIKATKTVFRNKTLYFLFINDIKHLKLNDGDVNAT